MSDKATAKPAFDLITGLGFTPTKMHSPEAVDLPTFAVEQFFLNYHNPDIRRTLTADHIEHGYATIVTAANTPELAELKRLLDHFFIFAFSTILVNDGQARARAFVERQYSSFAPDFINTLLQVTEDTIDAYPQISKYLIGPTDFEFSDNFYVHLNEFIKKMPIPGAIFLMKNFLHDEPCYSSHLPTSVEFDNRYLTQWGSPAPTLNPFVETNVPAISNNKDFLFLDPDKGSQGSEYHHSIVYVHIPDIIGIRVPSSASCATMDPIHTTAAFSWGPTIQFCSMNGKPVQLAPHHASITSLAFSPSGKFLASGDCKGNVSIQPIDDPTQQVFYQNVRSMVTCIAFCPRVATTFAVATHSGAIFVFDTREIGYKRVIAFHKEAVTALAIHPNCEYIASASTDGIIRLTQITKTLCVRMWHNNAREPVALKITHNGQNLLAAYHDGSIFILGMGNHHIISKLTIDAPLAGADYSPDDEYIVLIDRNGGLSIWNADSLNGEPKIVLRMNTIASIDVSYSRCGEIKVLGYDAPQIPQDAY